MDPLHKKETESFPVYKILYKHHPFLWYQPLGVGGEAGDLSPGLERSGAITLEC